MDKMDYIRLWNLYGALLTDTQREMGDMFFDLDLTVSEIASEKGVTRQAVSECLAGCRRQLEAFEGKVGAYGRLRGAEAWAEDFRGSHPEHGEETERLMEIIAGEAVSSWGEE